MAVLVVYGINAGYASRTRQGLIFLLFSAFMALGAIYSWGYLPDVQRVVYDGPDGKRRLETRSLEELGGGVGGDDGAAGDDACGGGRVEVDHGHGTD